VIGMRRIVCPVDLTPFSRRALEHAAVLARWYEAELVAFHVTPLLPTILGFPPGSSPRGLEPSEAELVCRELRQFVAHATAGLPRVEVAVRVGEPASEILQYARESAADLVVMGTHGRTGFDRLMLGSVTEKVLHKASCPLLTVPLQAPRHRERPLFAHVLCAVDFSPVSERAAAYALSLSQEAEGRLTLLHVVESLPSETLVALPQLDPASYLERKSIEARARLEKLVPEEARHWCQPSSRTTCGKPYREILRIAEEEQADIVVLGVHGHGALDRTLFGSTTQRVVRHAACPVLTIRS